MRFVGSCALLVLASAGAGACGGTVDTETARAAVIDAGADPGDGTPRPPLTDGTADGGAADSRGGSTPPDTGATEDAAVRDAGAEDAPSCNLSRPVTEPLLPSSSPVEACATPVESGGSFEQLVGRWIPCPSTALPDPSHAALEVSGTGRWQFLKSTPQGLLPASPKAQGFVEYGLGSLILRCLDGFSCGFASALRIGGDHLVSDATSLYRTAPAPYDLRNVPLRFGDCSIVGTWDVMPSDGAYDAPPQTIYFDDRGGFVAGSAGANLCDGFDRWGDYTVQSGGGGSGQLLLTGAGGDVPSCSVGEYTGFQVAIDATCNTMTLEVAIDNCTGGSPLRDGGTLKRRVAP